MGKDKTMEMTISDVKRDLPMVKVRMNNRLYWAKVTGRLNQFASVSPYQLIDNKKLVTTIMGPIVVFSWEAVTRAVNSGKPLQIDLEMI